MFLLHTLNELRGISSDALSRMQKRSDDLNRKIDIIRSDASRSDVYREEQCKIEREKLAGVMAEDFKAIKDIYEKIKEQKELWESTLLVLSFQKFSKLLYEDSQIRLATSNELKLMPLNILGLTLKNAKIDGNLPVLYQCLIVGESRREEHNFSEFVDISTDGIVVPEQAEAMVAILECWSNVVNANGLIADFFGRRTKPVDRLTMDREHKATEKLIDSYRGIIQ